MDAAGTIPPGGVDLESLTTVYARPGPFATVYLGTDPDRQDAEQRSRQRWRALRDELSAAGAPGACLDAIDEVVPSAHLAGESMAVIADEHEVLVRHHLDRRLDQDRGRWGPLPDVVPLLHWQQDQVPSVVALCDRGGADLVAHRPGGREIERTEGDGDPARKVAAGGWSQRRFQQRAEEDWAATAREVADEVVSLAARVDARIVVIGGDVRATQLLVEDLPRELDDRIRRIDHGRAIDGSDDERQREVHRLVATAVAEDSVALLEKFKEERGQHDRAADGPAATVEALNRAAVAVLFVSDRADRTGWVTHQPLPVGLDESTAQVGTDASPVEAPLVDALVRGAWASGASVRVVPRAGPVTDGVGALLRWS